MDLVDAVMPRYDFASRHEVPVAATPERTRDALTSLDTSDLLLTRALMGMRTVPTRLLRRSPPLRPARQREGRTIMPPPFVELTRTDLAAAYGLAGQFWKPIATPLALPDAAAFAEFADPGYAKAVIGFEIRPGPRGSVLATETRILATDAAARRSFGRYWLVIRAGSGLIRHDMLRAVRRRAEHG